MIISPKIMFPGYLILFVLSWVPVKINIKEILNVPGLYIISLSLILVITGVVMLAHANVSIKKAVDTNQLITSGLFRYIRNPMYGAHIYFIMPGICLLTNNAVTLLSVICTVILFNLLISKEEKILEENFGAEYVDYKKRVGRLIPGMFR